MVSVASISVTDLEGEIRWSPLGSAHSDANLLTVDSDDVNLSNLGVADKRILVDRIMKTVGLDNEQLLRRIKDRIKRVDLDLPKVEVRFEHLSVEADALAGSRAVPTLLNAALDAVDVILGCVNFSISKKRVNKILTDASGVLKPSRMCLLLGPPGSGKTTLLLALAGKLDKNLKVTGKITYCGREFKDFVPQRTGAYVSQHDIHIAEMTVRETFDFSAQCLGTGNRCDVLSELTRRERDAGIKPDPEIDAFMKLLAVGGKEFNLATDYILKVLGLDNCADVFIGDAMRRGLSGGEKKRLTVGEILVGPATALFMDEISTGLDSSTTFEMVKFIKRMVCAMDAQVIISLLQPAPETFELFDDIILLSEGQIVYQGPRENILEFFMSVGFKCPQRKGVADFLQEVTSRRDQEQYWFRDDKPYCYVTVSEFSNSFKSFHVGEQLSRNLSVPYDTSKVHPSILTAKKYGISSWDLMRECFARECLLMRRNSFVYVFKTVQLIILAAMTVVLFRGTKMPHETIADGGTYYGAIFFGLVSIMFNGYADLIMTALRLPVFYKQRDSLVYPVWAFGLSYSVLRVPISLLESGIWVVLTYYGIGFAPAPSRFFKQFLAYFFVHQTALTQFRFVASVGRTLLMSNTLGFFSNLLIFVLGGFIISKDDIRPWFIWAYWLSPLTYGLNAVAINEFLDIRWSKPNNDNKLDASTIGKAILKSRAVPVNSYWYWRSIGTLFGFILLFNLCFILAMTYLSPAQKSRGVFANLNESESKMNNKMRMDNVERSIELQNVSIGPIFADTKMVKTLKYSRRKWKDHVLQEVSLPFKPLSLVFNQLNYYIDMPSEMKELGVQGKQLQLLRNVSGAFRPGLLTALIGVTGAGKTTLLDVLAGRKTGGYIEGNISISGFPKRQETFARVSGYCEQNDYHSPHVTVHESLIFSAFLRLSPEIGLQTRKMFVEEIMSLVELNLLRDAMVGLSGVDGLSTEQRKRLTIAVELVANPSIIFMDEPTSGLDARAAAIVMRAIRNTVNTGRTVVCTIHQPSIDIFETFDELLLMQKGGQLIYAGELGLHSSHLIEYFESIPGVPKISEGYNPATWVLEITSPSFKPWLKLDFAEVYERSSIYKRNQELINELSIPSSGSMDLAFSKRYAQSFVTQCVACFWKQYRAYWRNTQYNGIRFFSTFVTGLIFCAVFWRRGKNVDKQQDLFNLMGAIYAALFFVGCNNANCVVPIVSIEMTVINRERAAGMYSSFAYAFAQVCIEIVYIAAQSLLYSLLLFSLIEFGWKPDKFFWFFFFLFMCFVYFTSFGMMTIAITRNAKVASIFLFFFYCLWNLFSGFIIPRKLIPARFSWLYWSNPVSWSLHGIIVSQLGELNNMVQIPGEPSVDVKTFLEQKLGYRHDFLGYIALAYVSFALFFIFIFAFSIKFLNLQKR